MQGALSDMIPTHKKILSRLDRELYRPAAVVYSNNHINSNGLKPEWLKKLKKQICCCSISEHILVTIVLSILVFVVCKEFECSNIISFGYAFGSLFCYGLIIYLAHVICKYVT